MSQKFGTFRGRQMLQVFHRLRAGNHVALVGEPSTGKTHGAWEALRRYILGDEKGIITEEADRDLVMGEDMELIVGLPTITSDELIGGWKRSSDGAEFERFWGPLTRAMQKGIPLFVNEFTRMNRKAQNTFVAPLSEGYLPCPQLSVEEQYVEAKPGFVVVMDMNTSEHDVSVEDLVWALGTRVRKVEFWHPTAEILRKILADHGVHRKMLPHYIKVYQDVNVLRESGEISNPLTARGLLQMNEDFFLEMTAGLKPHDAFMAAAHTTWIRDVANSTHRREKVEQIVEAIGRQIGVVIPTDSETEMAIGHIRTLLNESGVDRLGDTSIERIINHNGLTDITDVFDLSERDLKAVPGIDKRASQVKRFLDEAQRAEHPGAVGRAVLGSEMAQVAIDHGHLFFTSMTECDECMAHDEVRYLRDKCQSLWKNLVEKNLPL